MRICGNFLFALALATMTAAAQSPAQPHFEVTSIRIVVANYSNGASFSARLVDPSTWVAHNANIYYLIAQAYGPKLMSDPNRLLGVPKSLDDTAFEIQAKLPPNSNARDLRPMLQAMLAERFQLAIHTEKRPLRAAVITIAPGGPKLIRDTDCENPNRPVEVFPLIQNRAAEQFSVRNLPCGTESLYGSTPTMHVEQFRGVTLSEFAEDMGNGALEVVDGTGLPGAYDISFRYPVESVRAAPREDWPGIDSRNTKARMAAFTQQLGLHISLDHPSKQPLTVYVVDHVEKPTPN